MIWSKGDGKVFGELNGQGAASLHQKMPILCLVFTGTDKQASMNERAQAYIPRSSMVSPAEMYMTKGGIAHGMRPPPAEASMKHGMGIGMIIGESTGFGGVGMASGGVGMPSPYPNPPPPRAGGMGLGPGGMGLGGGMGFGVGQMGVGGNEMGFGRGDMGLGAGGVGEGFRGRGDGLWGRGGRLAGEEE